MRNFTIIIPTWNMGRFLEPLFNSIRSSAFAGRVAEIIFVCEKSTDGSEEVIANLVAAQGNNLPSVRMVQPEVRRGLFIARYLGAKAARTEKIMFVDSRIIWPQSTGQGLLRLVDKYPAMSSIVDIDVTKNLYSLYWQRSHESIFKKTYDANVAGIEVTPDNFDQYRIGGTCFYCSRDLFVRVSERYLETSLFSDDTKVMKDMVKEEHFFTDPGFRIQWEPRDQLKPFLKHLYVRGPGFAEYHIFEHRGWLFYAVVLGLLFIVAEVILLFTQPAIALALVGGALLALALSTAMIVKSLKEFLCLAPLHVGVILAYGFGALRGIWVIYKKRKRSEPCQA